MCQKLGAEWCDPNVRFKQLYVQHGMLDRAKGSIRAGTRVAARSAWRRAGFNGADAPAESVQPIVVCHGCDLAMIIVYTVAREYPGWR